MYLSKRKEEETMIVEQAVCEAVGSNDYIMVSCNNLTLAIRS